MLFNLNNISENKENYMRRDANLWRSRIWRFFFHNTPVWKCPPPPKKKEMRPHPLSNRPPLGYLWRQDISLLWCKVQRRFYPGDREIRSVSGRIPDYPREMACMLARKIKNKLAKLNMLSIIIKSRRRSKRTGYTKTISQVQSTTLQREAEVTKLLKMEAL